MRGYPILNDNISGRLESLDKRIARLERPHDINYAKRLSAQSFGLSQESNIYYGPNDSVVDDYISQRMYGPSVMWHVGGLDFDAINPSLVQLEWKIKYVGYEPSDQSVPKGSPTTYTTLDSGILTQVYGSVDWLYGTSGVSEWHYPATIIQRSTGADGLNIEGTVGTLLFTISPKGYPYGTGSTARFAILDNAFVGPDYEYFQL